MLYVNYFSIRWKKNYDIVWLILWNLKLYTMSAGKGALTQKLQQPHAHIDTCAHTYRRKDKK